MEKKRRRDQEEEGNQRRGTGRMAPTDTLAPRLPSHPRARRWARADPTSRPSGRREARTSRSTVKLGGGGGVGPQLNRNVTTEGQEAASAPKWRCLGGREAHGAD